MSKKYIRFGLLPTWGEKSINWSYLRLSQRDDLLFDIETGDADRLPEKVNNYYCAFCRSWRGVDPDKVFENGISVFEMSADGLPVISNRALAISLKIRLEKPAFLLTGDEIGKGADGEPLLVNVTAAPVTLKKDYLLQICRNWLTENEMNYF